jgi:hypothetical protein
MSHQPRDREPTVDFDFSKVIDNLDGSPVADIDNEFWALEAQLLTDILSWFLEAKNLSGVGARCATLVMYLRPQLLRQRSLREISKLENAPTAAALSKCLLQLETKFGLKPGRIQKPGWSREVFSKSARCAHEQRRPQQ